MTDVCFQSADGVENTGPDLSRRQQHLAAKVPTQKMSALHIPVI
jgi:hypothetical protein